LTSVTNRRRDTASASASRHRDSRLDNAKFLLIALVVIGHAIEPIRGTPVVDAVYMWIYSFHMPAFILISGYLSKSFDASPRRVEKLVLGVAVPYLIFWGLHVLLAVLLDRGVPASPLEPAWTLWFLVALFVWRLSVPVWQRLRWPLATAVGVSLATAFVELENVLGLGRLLSLLPFFVLGLLLRPEHLDVLRRGWVRALAVLTVAASAVVAVPAARYLEFEWFFWRSSLVDRDIDPLGAGLLLRLGCMLAALSLTAALLALVPRGSGAVTRLGAYTLYVYLGHSLLLRVAEHLGWYDLADGVLGLAVNTALGLALVFFLCLPWVRAVLRPLVEPDASWVLRSARPGEARSGAQRAGS
jgi:fucose 4-O-acetylase-like acetyltransferase